jgi:hypothetical protein
MLGGAAHVVLGTDPASSASTGFFMGVVAPRLIARALMSERGRALLTRYALEGRGLDAPVLSKLAIAMASAEANPGGQPAAMPNIPGRTQ